MGNPVEECGMVPAHAGVFKNVATKESVVIVSRALNRESTPLLLENYAAKGFHVKAKTCNWGPMAGFVCADARFTKNPDQVDWQKKQLLEAFDKHKAKKTPLFISDKRFKELTGKKFTIKSNEKIKVVITCKSPGGADFTFVAIARAKLGWQIYYDKTESTSKDLSKYLKDPEPDENAEGLVPFYAMVNPGSGKRGHLDAIAGDYDLFALYPQDDSAAADKHTQRAVEVKPTNVNKGKMSERMQQLTEVFTKVDIENEHAHMGNITPLITKIKTALNTGIKGTGYQGGEIVMHSDESGNPFSSAPDYPLLAFVPKEDPRAIHDQKEFIEFIKEMKLLGYRVTLNPRWNLPNFTITKKQK